MPTGGSAGAFAIFADAALPVVLADAVPSALLALAALPAILAGALQVHLLPDPLQMLRRLPCSRMPPPPHSFHWLRILPCSQMLGLRTPCTYCASCRARRCCALRTPWHGALAVAASPDMLTELRRHARCCGVSLTTPFQADDLPTTDAFKRKLRDLKAEARPL